VILSSYDDAITIKKMMDLGVSAYLTKTITPSLLNTLFEKLEKNEIFISPDAANNVAFNKLPTSSTPVMGQQVQWMEEEMSPRQKEVLEMLVNGKSTKEISTRLNLSSRTIDTHREKLMKKFGVNTTRELIAKVSEYKVV
jgi:DNA-binding NarL/FixJ family response regulator